jgi:NCS1 family nucleobase:cation symporter-1
MSIQNADPALHNEDLAPTPASKRTWSARDIAALWIGLACCVPTYMLAGGLVDLGMSWWQAVGTVALGNLIVLVPMVATADAGTRYGIPFPVLARASFGVIGANTPSLLRGLVACGWFGIQTWIGGSAIYHLLGALGGRDPNATGADLPLLGITLGELLCFLLFWVVQVTVLWRGIESIKVLEVWSAPFLIAMSLLLLAWAWTKAGGIGPMLHAPSQFGSGGAKEGQFLRVFFPALTGMVGFWATLSLNIPDFTRFAKSQRDQVLGQIFGLPTFMTLFSFLGVAVTSATVGIYGEAVPDPTALLGRLEGGIGVVLALLALSVATLTTNVAANVVSPANAVVNLAPRRFTFRHGAMVTAALGIAIFPWKLIETSEGYIFTWLIGYSALLGPIGGIVLADYYLLRGRRLLVDDLYRRGGAYEYQRGTNHVALLALGLGIAPSVPGFLSAAGLVEGVPSFWRSAYDYSWFVGFGIGGGFYWVVMRSLATWQVRARERGETASR